MSEVRQGLRSNQCTSARAQVCDGRNLAVGLSCILALSIGCASTLGDGEPPSEPSELGIGFDVSAVESTEVCADLPTGAEVVALTREGDLWIHTDDALLRVRPDGTRIESATGVASLDFALAPNSEELLIGIEGELWIARDAEDELTPLPLATALGRIEGMCGDPREDGTTLLSDRGAFIRRSDSWFAHETATDTQPVNITRLVERSGACAGRFDATWIETLDALWRVTPAGYQEIRWPYDPVEGAVLNESYVTTQGDALVVFHPERGWERFELRVDVSLVGAGPRELWLVAGDRVYISSDFENFERTTLSGSAERIYPHAVGAWVRFAEGQLCHVARGPLLRIREGRPDSEVRSGMVEVALELLDEEGTPLAGQEIIAGDLRAATDENGHALLSLPLALAGWNDLEIRTEGATRSVAYRKIEQVSFESAIAPIAEAHCAGSTCHGADQSDRISLMDHLSWVEHHVAIRAQIFAGRMPRTPAPDLSEEQIGKIRDWIETGMAE